MRFRRVLAVVLAGGLGLVGTSIDRSAAAPTSPVFISEVLADNTLSTANPLSDWIELANTGTVAQDLGGWKLKDSGTTATATWTFPSPTVLPAGGRLVVFADSTLTAPVAGTELHTSFGLSKNGEYLGLIRPDGSIAHEFTPNFPGLAPNVSYGVNDAGDLRSFSTPTPGAANGPGDLLAATAVIAAPARGFFTASTLITLTTTTPGAQIRYTLDGSVPSATNGTTYTAPFAVATTTTVRSTAIKAGFANAPASTNTYVFVASVLNQGTGIPGFPNGKQRFYGAGSLTVPEDTAMDQAVISQYTPAVVSNALTAIPTMSLTAPVDSIFGATGLYETPENAVSVEQPMSVELLYPSNPTANQQTDAGVESHSHDRLKRSLKLNFRAQYGASPWTTDLMKNAPLNGAGATNKFRSLILRAGNNRAWTRTFNPDATTFTEDELYRATQIAIEGNGVRGTFVHLYINGVYWGLYNVAERPDDKWAAAYLGGNNDNWYFRTESTPTSGDPARFNHVVSDLMNRDLSITANYTEMKDYLDVNAFADYMMLNWWFGKTDWPNNNWYVSNRNPVAPDTATGARYWAWDGEWALDRKQPDTLPPGAWVHPDFLPAAVPTTWLASLWKSLWANPEFRTTFYGRVATNTATGGPLTDASVLATFNTLNASVRDAVVAESARWGDALASQGQPTRTRDVDWQREVGVIETLINGNTARFIAALRAVGYYPAAAAPTFSPAPGTYTGPVTVTNPGGAGTVVYTLDGSDPTTNAAALTYSGPIALTRSTTIKAAVKVGTSFSAATTATYVLPSFVVTEMNYNPGPLTAGEIAAGVTSPDLFEYIEIKNVSTSLLSLGDLTFTTGITTPPLFGLVAPGEIVVLVAEPLAFGLKYGSGARVVGTYAGNLSNGGEQIVATFPAGIPAIDFIYDDIAPWPLTPDGTGPSLVVTSPGATTDLSLPASWTASPNPGGTPGFAPDTVPPTVVGVSPASGATAVSSGVAPVVTFSEPVAPAAAVTLAVDGGATVATGVAVGSTVTLTPSAALLPSTTYRITVPTTTKDLGGNAVAAVFTSTFTTAATPPPVDTTPPTVVSVSPVAGATGAATGVVPAVTFSEPVAPAAGVTLAVDGGATVATGVAVGSTVTLTPSAALLPGTTYRITVPTTTKDAAGNAIATAFTATFTTAAPVTTTELIKVARSTSRSPAVALQGNNWNVGESVVVFLDTAEAAVSVKFFLDNPTTGTAFRTEGLAPWDFNGGGIATATPWTSTLAAGSHTIRALLTRPNGTTVTFTSTFTVGGTPPPVDTTPPTVVSVSPVAGATGVAATVVPVVTFSEPVTPGSGVTLAVDGGATVGTGTAVGSTVTLSHAAALVPSTTYRVTVPITTKDAAGNAIAAAFTSTFTTAATPPPVDTTPPTVVSVSPVAGATGVATGVVPVVTFSEPVTPGSGVTLAVDGGATVGAGVAVGSTVSLTPSTALLPATTYRVTVPITTKDAAGNAIAAAFTSTFTTAAAPPPPTTDPLKVSRSSTRASSVAVQGNVWTVGESVYVFLDTIEPAVNVKFYLDNPTTGVVFRTEGLAPWDFNGGGIATATPYVNRLTVGVHTIRAVLTRPNGTTVTYTSTLTVA
jgi:CotH kinase protein/Bacterial Ig-like domain/Lamin Tail Domain/Fn3 associated/Chitobiase/beta-hexosaminidase C-terminal domain